MRVLGLAYTLTLAPTLILTVTLTLTLTSSRVLSCPTHVKHSFESKPAEIMPRLMSREWVSIVIRFITLVRVRARVRLRVRVRVRGGVAQRVPFDQPAQPLATLALLDPLAPRRSTRHELG